MARQLREGERDGGCVDANSRIEGTPFYLAPEILDPALQTAATHYAPATDVWALGVTFFELACLERPYSGDSLPTLAYRILGDLSSNPVAEAAASDERCARRLHAYSAELRGAIEGVVDRGRGRAIVIDRVDA